MGCTFGHNEHSSTLQQVSWEVSLNALSFGLQKNREKQKSEVILSVWVKQLQPPRPPPFPHNNGTKKGYYVMQAYWSVPLQQPLVLSFQLQQEQCLWLYTWEREKPCVKLRQIIIIIINYFYKRKFHVENFINTLINTNLNFTVMVNVNHCQIITDIISGKTIQHKTWKASASLSLLHVPPLLVIFGTCCPVVVSHLFGLLVQMIGFESLYTWHGLRFSVSIQLSASCPMTL